MQAQSDFKGWLLTCDQNRQKQATKDAFNFLARYIEEYYDDLIGQEIQKKLKSEQKEISPETQLKQCKRRFLSRQKCVIFVKINQKFKQIDPVLIVDKIMEDVYLRNKEITRFCHKILPVQRAFKAEHFKMLDVVDELFNQKTVPGHVKSWSLNFKLRNNSKFNYKEVLKSCDVIATKYGHFSEIYYPQWTLSIEIANHLMCLCISQKYKQYNEYKLHKRIPKQQRVEKAQTYKKHQSQKNSLQNVKQQNALLDEEELRSFIQKTKDDQKNSKDFENESKQQHHAQNSRSQRTYEPGEKTAKSIKNSQLLDEAILVDQQDDIDLF